MAERVEDQGMEEDAMRTEHMWIMAGMLVAFLLGCVVGLFKAELVSRDLSEICLAHEEKLDSLLEDQDRVYVLFPGELGMKDQILLAKVLLEKASGTEIWDPGPELEAQLDEAWKREHAGEIISREEGKSEDH